MAIAEPTTSASPFAKFSELGQRLVGAYVGRTVRQQQNFDTKAPLFKPDKKPLNEEINYMIVMPGTTAVVGNLDSPDAVELGDELRFAFKGYQWGQLIDGCKELPAAGAIKAGQRASGDVIEITLVGWSTSTDNAEAARKKGYTVEDGRIVIRNNEQRDDFVLARTRANQPANLGKDFSITVRRPTAADAEWEAKADAARGSHVIAKDGQIVGGASVATEAPNEGGGGDSYPDEEPF